jgi:hypothetical protein
LNQRCVLFTIGGQPSDLVTGFWNAAGASTLAVALISVSGVRKPSAVTDLDAAPVRMVCIRITLPNEVIGRLTLFTALILRTAVRGLLRCTCHRVLLASAVIPGRVTGVSPFLVFLLASAGSDGDARCAEFILILRIFATICIRRTPIRATNWNAHHGGLLKDLNGIPFIATGHALRLTGCTKALLRVPPKP